MLGPLVNPAFPRRQLVGVFSLELARQYAYLYQNDTKDFVVLHSVDGYDEVSLTGPFKVFHNQGERMLGPADLGLTQLSYADIRGGESVEASAAIFRSVLEGKGTSAQNSAVIANAGMALYAADQRQTLEEATGKAREALVSGKALATFRKLIEMQS